MDLIQMHEKLVDQDIELQRLQHVVTKYENGIRKLRDQWQSGDDKCWKDLEETFALLPEGFVIPKRDESCELVLCQQYIRSCHHPEVIYISPQRRIEELEALLQKIKQLTPVSSKLYQMISEVLG